MLTILSQQVQVFEARANGRCRIHDVERLDWFEDHQSLHSMFAGEYVSVVPRELHMRPKETVD